jgi:hypothetical protein
MTSDQPPPGTGGEASPGLDDLLPPGSVVTVTGPWTVRSCVTAACTGCGAVVPLDEDTSTTPHFDDTAQAAQELVQNWGWSHQRGTWPKDDELLCPACAAPPGGARPARKGNGPKATRLSPRDLEWARTRVKAVTDWIATREGSSPPGTAAVEAAVRILATPPHRRNTSHSVHAATIYRVNGHLVAVYRNPGHSEVVTAECSCPHDESVCEHLLVALAYEDHL